MPLKSFTIVHKDAEFRKDMEDLKSYIQAEMNVKEVEECTLCLFIPLGPS